MSHYFFLNLFYNHQYSKKDYIYRLCHDIEFVIYLGTVPATDANPDAPSLYVVSDVNSNEYYTHLSSIFTGDNYMQINSIGSVVNVISYFFSFFIFILLTIN